MEHCTLTGEIFDWCLDKRRLSNLPEGFKPGSIKSDAWLYHQSKLEQLNWDLVHPVESWTCHESVTHDDDDDDDDNNFYDSDNDDNDDGSKDAIDEDGCVSVTAGY